MSDTFYQADLTDLEFEQNKAFARGMFKEGAKPSFSTSTLDTITAGYGRLDPDGFWEYPLPVNQETKEVEVTVTEEF